MSGGVDSSVAAALLKEQGHEVVGISMAIYDAGIPVKNEGKHGCYGPEEKEDMAVAAAVCRKLGIPFHVLDLRKEYRECVINYFRHEYVSGRTPNPCIVCNRYVKFGFLLQKALETGISFDIFATGHYARIVRVGNQHALRKAADRSKDQSYFLYALTPAQLAGTIFPLGTLTKARVREIARNMGLENADRRESQDFAASGDYSVFFRSHDAGEGDIVDQDGKLLGKHQGIIHYTVGQRRGLGISSDTPLYVIDIDPERNRLVVGEWESIFSRGLIVSDVVPPFFHDYDLPLRAKVKIRLRHREAEGTVYRHDGHRARILFEEPQMSVTPGQSAVFYKEDMVLGGGIIEQAIRHGGAIGIE